LHYCQFARILLYCWIEELRPLLDQAIARLL
jgi:hypothetical protein